eukprot:800174-Alexandrium_andersonii.AAC.1
MQDYGAPSRKTTWLYSNMPWISELDKHKPAVPYEGSMLGESSPVRCLMHVGLVARSRAGCMFLRWAGGSERVAHIYEYHGCAASVARLRTS